MTALPKGPPLLLYLLAFGISLILVQQADFVELLFTARLDQLSQTHGVAPGVDLTLILAWQLASIADFTPSTALLATSLSSAPFILALCTRTNLRLFSPLSISVMILAHPFAMALLFAGAGWAVLGFYAIWRMFAELPQMPAQQGMPLIGMAFGGGLLTIPGFGAYALPMAVMLFLCAPHHMLGRHMGVYYLLSLTPLAMVWTGLSYTGFVFGGDAPAPLSDEISIWHRGLAMLLLAPALLRLMPHPFRGATLATLFALLLCLTGQPVSTPLFFAAAGMAQWGLITGARLSWPWMLAGHMGGLVVLLGYDYLFLSL